MVAFWLLQKPHDIMKINNKNKCKLPINCVRWGSIVANHISTNKHHTVAITTGNTPLLERVNAYNISFQRFFVKMRCYCILFDGIMSSLCGAKHSKLNETWGNAESQLLVIWKRKAHGLSLSLSVRLCIARTKGRCEIINLKLFANWSFCDMSSEKCWKITIFSKCEFDKVS